MKFTIESLQDSMTRQALAVQIKADIDKFILSQREAYQSSRISASELGHECARYIWNKFHWLKLETFDAKKLRIFERGNFAEPRFLKWLRGMKADITDLDPKRKGEKNEQFHLTFADNFAGGFLDGRGTLPYEGLENWVFLCEFKTHNEKSFKELVKFGVAHSKPQHYAQMCIYGKEKKLQYGLYLAINVNDEDIYPEIVPLDFSLAEDLQRKAIDIVYAERPPAKIAEDGTFWKCKRCNFHGICHNGESVEKNCRSCINSKPMPGGKWYCNYWQDMIPYENIKSGCEAHRGIINS